MLSKDFDRVFAHVWASCLTALTIIYFNLYTIWKKILNVKQISNGYGKNAKPFNEESLSQLWKLKENKSPKSLEKMFGFLLR